MKNKKGFMRLPFLLMGLFLVFAISCDKEDDNNGDSANTFKDSRDGKVYKTVKIGNQIWMAENLAYAPSSGNYWAYDNDDANVETYGYLYDWQTALNICPTGWHLPSDEEWTELTDYLGTDAGSKLAGNAILWTDGTLDQNANFGETAFTALPGGSRRFDGTFGSVGNCGFWWSATEYNTYDAGRRLICYDGSGVYMWGMGNEEGFSVRCLRD